MRLFLDTNVFFDFVFKRVPFYEDSKSVMAFSGDDDKELFISALTIVTGVYVSKKYNHTTEEIKETFLKVLDFVNIADLSRQNVVAALESSWQDFEDCTQYETALDCGADYIVTRNKKDFIQSSITVLTPSELIERLG